jgi:hypothetical protein
MQDYFALIDCNNAVRLADSCIIFLFPFFSLSAYLECVIDPKGSKADELRAALGSNE